MNHLLRPPADGPVRTFARPGGHPLQLLGLETATLGPGMTHSGEADELERCILLIGGRCTVAVEGKEWKDIGERATPFDGLAHAIYVPRDSGWEVRGPDIGEVTVAISSAPAENRHEAYHILPEESDTVYSGRKNWRREISYPLHGGRVADKLLVGEIRAAAGHWSSSPPHRHEITNMPEEVFMEEIYYFKFRPKGGFGAQFLYTDDREIDTAYLVRDGDAVALPRGYHPAVAGPGYAKYYMCVLAGDNRILTPRYDPEHAWLVDADRLIDLPPDPNPRGIV